MVVGKSIVSFRVRPPRSGAKQAGCGKDNSYLPSFLGFLQTFSTGSPKSTVTIRVLRSTGRQRHPLSASIKRKNWTGSRPLAGAWLRGLEAPVPISDSHHCPELQHTHMNKDLSFLSPYSILTSLTVASHSGKPDRPARPQCGD